MDSYLGKCAGIQGVEQLRIVQKHGGFVIFSGDGVIDVGEGEGLRESVPHLKNSIRPDAADGYGVLYGLRNGKPFFFPRGFG